MVELHRAEDGLLARVRVPGGRLSAAQLRALAAAARLGNGIVDLTSRQNVQVRGLSDEDRESLVELLRDGGLLPSLAHDRARNIVAPPGGRFDAVVAALDAAICADPSLADLGGRHLFAVGCEHPSADVTLLPSTDGVPLAEAVAQALVGKKYVSFAPETGPDLTGYAITATVPLGRLDPDALNALAPYAPVWIGTDRTITTRNATPQQLQRIGLITGPSGWTGLTACAGLGACAKAERDVRAIAAARAAERRPSDPPEHYAACPRGCGA